MKDKSRTFPFLGPCKKILNPPCSTPNLRSLDLHQKQKDEILDSRCLSHPWIKPGAQKMRFQPTLNKIFCSKSPTSTHQQLEHYELKNYKKITKITKLGLLSLLLWFLTKVHYIRIEKQIHVLPSWQTILDCLIITINLREYNSNT